VELNILPWK